MCSSVVFVFFYIFFAYLVCAFCALFVRALFFIL